MGYPGPVGERIPHQHQAIVTTYKFNCCGNITEWGVDLNPVEDNLYFNFDFQVWRPSSTVNETGCYSLVENYAATSISIETMVTESHVARVTPLYQLQFQPGDVLGFYVESETQMTPEGNGVVLLDDESDAFTSEKLWYASIISRSSQSGSCPYPIGTDGVLNISTQAAPVISISTLVYSCTRSPISITPSATLFTVASQDVSASGSIGTTNSMSLASIGLTSYVITSDPKGTVNSVSLITGAVVALGVLCIAVISLIIIIVTTIFIKRRRTVPAAMCTSDSTSTVFEMSNPTYGKLV